MFGPHGPIGPCSSMVEPRRGIELNTYPMFVMLVAVPFQHPTQGIEMPEVICTECKEPFQGVSSRKFCSRSCSVTFNNKKSPKRKRHGGPRKPCPVCGTEPEGRNKYCRTCIANGAHLHFKTDLKDMQTSTSLRNYILRTREYVCVDCRLSEWRGQPIPLEVEHVDGNSDNNTEENLKLLCPNCHALTPTYKSRNRGNSARQKKRRLRYKEGKTY